MRILVTGPSGSGKTTQAEILARKLNLCLVDAGEILRNFAKEDKSKEGENIKKEMQEGHLVEDKVAADLIRQRLSETDCQKGFVMDGYPRSLASLQLFDPSFDQVFYLDIVDSEVEKRLILRGREDDKSAAIGERLKFFHQMTEPVLEHYGELGRLVRIDGQKTIAEVASEIDKSISGGLGCNKL